MTTDIKATELEIVSTFEGYSVARYQGKLGIWAIYQETINWDAMRGLPNDAELILLDTPETLAMQLEGDCGDLLDIEHFHSHVYDLKAEGNYLASLEA